jgi:hypothetical protein
MVLQSNGYSSVSATVTSNTLVLRYLAWVTLFFLGNNKIAVIMVGGRLDVWLPLLLQIMGTLQYLSQIIQSYVIWLWKKLSKTLVTFSASSNAGKAG